MDVKIELFPLNKSDGSKFVIEKFFAEIISLDVDEVNGEVLDTTQKIMQLE